MWYMSLREDGTSEQINTYIRVGHELNGLYTKIKKNNPYYDESKSAKRLIDDQINLEVVGISKLSSEIKAVEKVGYNYLRPDLLNVALGFEDEIIEERYDNNKLSNLSIQ